MGLGQKLNPATFCWSDRSFICVLRVSILILSTIFILGFGNGKECGIVFVFNPIPHMTNISSTYVIYSNENSLFLFNGIIFSLSPWINFVLDTKHTNQYNHRSIVCIFSYYKVCTYIDLLNTYLSRWKYIWSLTSRYREND